MQKSDLINRYIIKAYRRKDSAMLNYYIERHRLKLEIRRKINWLAKALDITIQTNLKELFRR